MMEDRDMVEDMVEDMTEDYSIHMDNMTYYIFL